VKLGTQTIQHWLQDAHEHSQIRVEPIRFEECEHWSLREGAMIHDTGGFFALRGLRIESASPRLNGFVAPMIDQPQPGWLAFLVRQGPSGLEWLLQAKTEPGNVYPTQIAPSIQATPSNYNRLHGGAPTLFLEHIHKNALYLSLGAHSEQGSKFLWKFNKNAVIALPTDMSVEAPEPFFRWCSSHIMRELLGQSNCLNTDARSAIATAPWVSLAEHGELFGADVLKASYAKPCGEPVKARLSERVTPVVGRAGLHWVFDPLDSLEGWDFTPDGIINAETGAPALTYARIDVQGREVSHWCQPFLTHAGEPDHVLLMRIEDGVAQFFIRSHQEPGFGLRREFSPSFQDGQADRDKVRHWMKTDSAVLAEVSQSDEGGRFMQARARYRIVLVGDTPPPRSHPTGMWVPLSVLEHAMRTPGRCTNELRTLGSLILITDFDHACRKL
jgi:dTDP-4-dehydro-6-deoxy-alpha-D-glucopyranose 2,3-dehydratase